MSQPVKLSDALVLDARLSGEVFQRSIAGQVEYWARLGRTLDELLNAGQIQMLARSGSIRPLSELIGTMETAEGRERLERYLESTPYPHFQQHPHDANLLIRTEADGETSVGRFVNRQFVIAEDAGAEQTARVTPKELAAELKTSERKLRTWLRAQPELELLPYARWSWDSNDPFLKEIAARFHRTGVRNAKNTMAVA